MPKAFTTFIQNLRNSYEETKVDLTLTNGKRALSLSLRPLYGAIQVTANLTPAEGRALASELLARAEEIEKAVAL